MNRDQLFLLKSNFMDDGKGPYFCPECAEVLGLLELYPALKQQLEIKFIDFPRPRPELAPLLGEENQGCPVLVLNEVPAGCTIKVKEANGHSFIQGSRQISEYLACVHGTGIPH